MMKAIMSSIMSTVPNWALRTPPNCPKSVYFCHVTNSIHEYDLKKSMAGFIFRPEQVAPRSTTTIIFGESTEYTHFSTTLDTSTLETTNISTHDLIVIMLIIKISL